VLKGLAVLNYVIPSEIQQMLIPKALQGGDLLGQARTGTGKTAAFGIPVLCRAVKGEGIQSLILTPTRELAVQVADEIRRMGQFTPLRCIAVYGGQKIAGDIKALHTKPEIVVGTPGRVIDLLDRRQLSLADIRFMILDEVDRMLDIGFRDDIRNILSRIKGGSGFRVRDNDPPSSDSDRRSGESRTHQTIFVSATFTEEIERLARRFMQEPVEKLVAPGADDKPTVDKVEQYYISVEPWDKYRMIRALLEQEKPELAIVFTRTKHGAEKLAKNLSHDGIDCREIHGNLAQNKRDRVMKNFKTGKFDVLVATDLASRGIDVADISHIINYDVPEDPEAYVHRIGRTARMGKGGKAFTLVTREQGDELTRIENLINMIIAEMKIEGFNHRPPPDRGPAEPAPLPPPPNVQDQKKGLRLGAKMPVRRRRR
jgi:ATP-dependent RNA helicase DeaD